MAFSAEAERTKLGSDGDGDWFICRYRCPECKRFIFEFQVIRMIRDMPVALPSEHKWLAYPHAPSRAPLPAEGDDTDVAEDYREACLVLFDSPKASAALSRRCLQNLLRKKAGVRPDNLGVEIQQVLDSRTLATHLADSVDGIRNVGNFAAHPVKSKQSGEVIPVEPGEAEWNLDVLEALFDFYYVQPARLQAKRDALNKKLSEAGKPPMK